MNRTREKGILSAGLIVGVILGGVLGGEIGVIDASDGLSLSEFLIIWFIGVVTVTPFWLLFEAIVEKIKE